MFSPCLFTFFASLILQFSCSVVSNSLWPYGLQHARPPCPSLSPLVCLSSWPLSRWCHHTISPSVTPFSSRLQSFPASGDLFQRVGSSHQVAKVLELQLYHQSFQWVFRVDFIWDGLVWSPCSPRDSQESSPTAPQFESISLFGTQPSLMSNSHIHTWLLEKPSAKWCLCFLTHCLGLS